MKSSAHQGDDATPARAPHIALCIVGLLTLAVAAHWRALDAGFHLDDFYRATDNPEIESVAPIGRHFVNPETMATLPHLVQYRPLLPLSLSLTHAAATTFGVEPVMAHHAGNLLLHLLAVALVFLLTRALLCVECGEPQKLFIPVAAAALFAAHPVAGVAVNYVCNRDLLLALTFLLSALLAYTHAARTGRVSSWLICGLCLLGGLLSKQNAALFPLIALAYELTLGRRAILDRVLWARVGGLTLLVAAYLAFVRYGIGFSDADQLVIAREPLEYPLTELRLHLVHYARNIVWPLYLHPLPAITPTESFAEPGALLGAPFIALAISEPGAFLGALFIALAISEPGVLLGALFIALAISMAWRSARTRPLLAFSVFAYFGWLIMTSSIIPMRSFAEDYRQLISLPFACVLLAVGLKALPRAASYLGLGVMCLLLVIASNTNAQHWETEESLWGRAVELGTTSQGHLNYGRSIFEEDPAQAELHYRRAIELSPENVYAKINLGLLLVDTGRAQEGIASVQEAALESPEWPITHYWLARCLVTVGRSDAALTSAAQAHELEPRIATYADLYTSLLHQRARELQVNGQVPESLPLLEKLHAIAQHIGDSRFLHGWALQSEGSFELAIGQYREHLHLDSSYAKARLNMAYALRDLGRHDEAAAELHTLLSMDPQHADARALLDSLGE